ncbi:tetratricopeptide repeat protein, partial [Vibrio parahaemolyticus]
IRYDFGQGVAQDHAEAVRWYRRAADLGNVIAMKNLGLSYRDGEGIGKDFAEARRWLEKAAAAGDEDAKK